MHRRDFVLTGCLASLTCGVANGEASQTMYLEDAHAIGSEALREGAVPKNAAQISRALGLATSPDSSIYSERWNDRISEDFARGDTIKVAGWILSRTEVQLCALLALST